MMIYKDTSSICVDVYVLDAVLIRGYAASSGEGIRYAESYLGRAWGAFYYVWLFMLDLL